MATKRKRLFLYSAIACLVGIILIFVFDGYLGIYDTVHVTAGEQRREIGPDYWQDQRRGYAYPEHIRAEWGEPVHFSYEIKNRRFSTYSATVEASVWKSNEKVIDLFRQDISLSSFDKITMEWTLPAGELARAGMEISQYTVKINRGEVELGQGIVFRYPEEPLYPNKVPLPR